MFGRALRQEGYTVLEVSNAIEAVQLYEASDIHIDLLLTDVIMPEMSGTHLATKLKERQPSLKVLFVSGYADEIDFDEEGFRLNGFLQKPLKGSVLCNKVYEVLSADA